MPNLVPIHRLERFGARSESAESEALEEGQQFVLRSVSRWLDAECVSARKRFLLQPHVRVEVHLRRLGGLVPQPECDHGAVHTVITKIHGGGVSTDMWGDFLPFE